MLCDGIDAVADCSLAIAARRARRSPGARTDHLTGLANRREFERVMDARSPSASGMTSPVDDDDRPRQPETHQ